MTLESWLTIQEIYADWPYSTHSSANRGFRTQIDDFLEHFEAGVIMIKDGCADKGVAMETAELTTAVTLMALAPLDTQQTEQPVALWQQLGQLAQEAGLGDQPEDIRNLVIAWGCGWGRTVDGPSDSWNGRWSNAIFALQAMLESSINATLWRLYNTVDHLASPLTMMLDQKRELAGLLVMELIHGRCRCGKHVKSCKAKNGQHECGRDCCRPEHNLATWEPSELSLQAFLAQSVRGNAGSALLIGALSNGTLTALLEDEIGLLISNVEFKVCHSCNEETIIAARQKQAEPKGRTLVMYEGSSCPTCKSNASRTQTYFKFRKNWILIPYERGGSHELLERWRCRQCRNLYPLMFAHCPLCQTEHPQRKTAVWVYRPRIDVD